MLKQATNECEYPSRIVNQKECKRASILSSAPTSYEARCEKKKENVSFYGVLEMRRRTGCFTPDPPTPQPVHTLRHPKDRPVSSPVPEPAFWFWGLIVQGFSGDVLWLRKLIRFARFRLLYGGRRDERTQPVGGEGQSLVSVDPDGIQANQVTLEKENTCWLVALQGGVSKRLMGAKIKESRANSLAKRSSAPPVSRCTCLSGSMKV